MKLKIKYYLKLIFALSLVSFVFSSCKEESILTPAEISKEVLEAAPETIRIENKDLTLSTYLQRDFMPVSPPGGQPLNAVVFIQASDSSEIPVALEADAIYIINQDEVWKSFFDDNIPPENSVTQLVRIARDGPKWEPGIYVDVIVSLTYGKDKMLIRAADQLINRTD